MAQQSKQQTGSAAPAAAPSPNRSRRKLLQGGVGGAPLLLTLVSRPVLGHNQCTTPSGFVSMPTSRHGQPQTCLGRTPGYWKQTQHFNQWPAPYYPTKVTGPGGHEATKFKDVFTPTPYPGNTTFLQVLEMGGGPPNDVARHIVAAVLNVAKGWAPVLTLAVLQNIWMQYMNTGGGTSGYFEPTAGIKWYHDEITAYLKSTMPL